MTEFRRLGERGDPGGDRQNAQVSRSNDVLQELFGISLDRHAALAKRTPAELYQPSSRAYPARLREPEYPARFSVRRVCGSGEMKWRGTFIYLTQVLAGEPVGLDPIDERHWRIYFGPVPLGILDSYTKRLSEIPVQPLIGDRH